MISYEQTHYKENSPEITINKLDGILSGCGIEIDEAWPMTSSLGTHSLRVSIKGTNIGTNGKGVSKVYARASAMAEFFERFQNNILGHTIPNPKLPYVIANDEKYMTAAELLSDRNSYTDFYFAERGMENASLEQKIANFETVNRYDKTNGDCGTYLSLPFYSIKDNKVVYLPYGSYSAMYGSNGMCAGNTPQEALVQGLAEIVERIVQKKVFVEKTAFPDIPEEVIKRYPYIYEMYKKSNENDKYSVVLKDCSFGGKYPVVALCIVEKNTGRYGIKLGCHPNIGIAMERTFTEVTQGIDIFEYSKKRSWLDFSNSGIDSAENISNSYKIGLSQYPYQFFSKTPDYTYCETREYIGCSNAEILKQWVMDFLPEHDILIRDVSFTGFPSYHIIIPGLSEMQSLSDHDIRTRNTRSYVSYLLTHTDEINEQSVRYIIAILKAYSNSIFENALSTYFPPDLEMDLPFERVGSDLYLLAMCYALKGDYSEATNYMKMLQKKARNHDTDVDTINKIDCITHYMAGMQAMNDHDMVLDYLKVFFSDEFCDMINDVFRDREDIIKKQYKDIVMCKHNEYDDFRYKVANRYVDIQIDQSELSHLFESADSGKPVTLVLGSTNK